MKDSFLNLKDNLNERINKINESISNLENSNKKIKNDLLNFQNYFDELSENITELSNLIINETAKTTEIEIENTGFSNFVVDSIIISLSEPLIKIIKYEYEIMGILFEIEDEVLVVETKTSLDLLFIMDLTGSMTSYIDETKKNLIYIMKRIIDQSPGIDINLGFIGYRDIYEEYVDLEFTKEHSYIENQISDVIASGGGDIPEDVAWAFERALNKSWKSDAKFIVFVTDAPGHGSKYSPYDWIYANGIPGRKEIEESVKELAENNVSMFCFRIHSNTDKMFSIFKNIYDNYSWNIFELVDISGHVFTDEIVNSCNNYYLKQKTKSK
jgi:vacuole morphology and inheritance protein 14